MAGEQNGAEGEPQLWRRHDAIHRRAAGRVAENVVGRQADAQGGRDDGPHRERARAQVAKSEQDSNRNEQCHRQQRREQQPVGRRPALGVERALQKPERAALQQPYRQAGERSRLYRHEKLSIAIDLSAMAYAIALSGAAGDTTPNWRKPGTEVAAPWLARRGRFRDKRGCRRRRHG
jgi:hypothetical protein